MNGTYPYVIKLLECSWIPTRWMTESSTTEMVDSSVAARHNIGVQIQWRRTKKEWKSEKRCSPSSSIDVPNGLTTPFWVHRYLPLCIYRYIVKTRSEHHQIYCCQNLWNDPTVDVLMRETWERQAAETFQEMIRHKSPFHTVVSFLPFIFGFLVCSERDRHIFTFCYSLNSDCRNICLFPHVVTEY